MVGKVSCGQGSGKGGSEVLLGALLLAFVLLGFIQLALSCLSALHSIFSIRNSVIIVFIDLRVLHISISICHSTSASDRDEKGCWFL